MGKATGGGATGPVSANALETDSSRAFTPEDFCNLVPTILPLASMSQYIIVLSLTLHCGGCQFCLTCFVMRSVQASKDSPRAAAFAGAASAAAGLFVNQMSAETRNGQQSASGGNHERNTMAGCFHFSQSCAVLLPV
ncbi:MAG: hypothetical protein U0105_07145 [Candidatus Obscuribacterales bacterium]